MRDQHQDVMFSHITQSSKQTRSDLMINTVHAEKYNATLKKYIRD